MFQTQEHCLFRNAHRLFSLNLKNESGIVLYSGGICCHIVTIRQDCAQLTFNLLQTINYIIKWVF